MFKNTPIIIWILLLLGFSLAGYYKYQYNQELAKSKRSANKEFRLDVTQPKTFGELVDQMKTK